MQNILETLFYLHGGCYIMLYPFISWVDCDYWDYSFYLIGRIFYLSFGFISSIGLLSYNIIYIYISYIYIYIIYIYISYIYIIYIYIYYTSSTIIFDCFISPIGMIFISPNFVSCFTYCDFSGCCGSDGPWMQGVYRVLLTAYGSDRDSMGIWWWSSGISRGYKDGFFRGFF